LSATTSPSLDAAQDAAGQDTAGHDPAAWQPRFALTAMALLVVALGSCTAENETAAPGVAHVPALAYAPATGSGPPSKLQNMNAGQVVAMLGEPGFKREENPAQVWRYNGKSCVLELFLYRLDTDFQVRYIETRDAAKANAVPQDPCIAQIAAQKRAVASN